MGGGEIEEGDRGFENFEEGCLHRVEINSSFV
jgi:hypothetical protein